MLHNITWLNYWGFIVITLVIYYVVVIVIYYNADIRRLFTGQSNFLLRYKEHAGLRPGHLRTDDANSNSNNSIETEKGYEQEATDDNISMLINGLKQDISITLENAGIKNLVREEVLYSLRKILENFSAINYIPFKRSINEYIQVEFSKYYPIHLDEVELNILWGK